MSATDDVALVDTGYAVDTSPADLAGLGGGIGHEVLRVEQVAEHLAARAGSPSALLDGFRAELRDRAGAAVALKSVIAYRSGLGLPGEQPGDGAARPRSCCCTAGRSTATPPTSPTCTTTCSWTRA